MKSLDTYLLISFSPKLSLSANLLKYCKEYLPYVIWRDSLDQDCFPDIVKEEHVIPPTRYHKVLPEKERFILVTSHVIKIS